MNKQLFLVKARKDEVRDFIVPRHPEYVFAKKISDTSWEAEHKDSGETIHVVRVEKGKFYEFEITWISQPK